MGGFGNRMPVSSNGSFALGFFTPPDSNNRYIGLWYNLIPDHTIVWVANRKNPLINSSGVLSVTKDGRLTISNQTSFVVWSTNATKGLNNPIAQLLDNGNLVVKQSGDASENYALMLRKQGDIKERSKNAYYALHKKYKRLFEDLGSDFNERTDDEKNSMYKRNASAWLRVKKSVELKEEPKGKYVPALHGYLRWLDTVSVY